MKNMIDKTSLISLILGTALTGSVSADQNKSGNHTNTSDSKKCEQMKCGAGKCGSMKSDPACDQTAEKTYNKDNFKKAEKKTEAVKPEKVK